VLVGDDGVDLERAGERILASPAPAIAGLLEVRNVGLLRYPVARGVQVALVIRLDRAAERLPDGPGHSELLGCRIPLVRLWPDSPVLALRALAALSQFGLLPTAD
jgi:serine kinase of HPr protein (carbohydrate metabolism regulator)